MHPKLFSDEAMRLMLRARRTKSVPSLCSTIINIKIYFGTVQLCGNEWKRCASYNTNVNCSYFVVVAILSLIYVYG